MSGFLLRAEDVLRGNLRTDRSTPSWQTLRWLAAFVCLFGIVYGGVMGSFGGAPGERILQVVYAAVKVPLLLLLTFLLSLPSFWMLHTLLGVRSDLPQALRALVATQAGLTIILASLAPFTALWYVSSASYQGAILFNAAMFTVASAGAQRLLRNYYRPLIAHSAVHRWLLRAWIVVYAFVGIQMGWMLRPFVGDPQYPTRFFREDTWGNAYVIVARLLWRVLAS